MKYKIVLFDGVCHLCNNTVRFTIKRDSHRQFKFAPFQSKIGKVFIEKYQIKYTKNISSVVLIDEGKVYYKSTAILRMFRYFNGLWKLIYGLMIIPAFLRDKIYTVVGNHRYQWFGKYNECPMPDKNSLDRFDLSDLEL